LRLLIILTGIWVMSKETVSKSPGYPHRIQPVQANRSPSSPVSSMESIPKGPQQNVRRPLDLQRSSTSPPSPGTNRMQLVSHERANSAGVLGARREIPIIGRSVEIGTSLLPPGSCYSRDEAGLHAASQRGDPGSTTRSSVSGPLHHAIDDRERVPPMGHLGTSQTTDRATALKPSERESGNEPVDREEGKEMFEGQETKQHPKKLKWGKFRAACRSLATPCVRPT
jgi:hypothetical protein